MTGPHTYTEYRAHPEYSQQEWDSFLKRRKELMDMMMQESSGLVQRPQPGAPDGGVLPQGHPMSSSVPDPTLGSLPRTQGRDDLLGQARAWDIEGAESMHPQQLAQMIQQRRDNIPRDQQTSLGSVATAAVGAAAEAAASTTRVLGNMLGIASKIPFGSNILDALVGQEKAKNWMYDLSSRAKEVSELAAMSQPGQDKSAYEFLSSAGKTAGYILPAVATWNALGALGGYGAVAGWTARVGSPIARAAIQGGLSGLVMEAGSDEAAADKAQAVALGALMGGASGFSKGLGHMVGGGAVGAGIGAGVGDTPEERSRNAAIGGVAGAMLPLVAPMLAGAFRKVSADIPTPMDSRFEQARKGQEPVADLLRLQSGGPRKASATATVSGEPMQPTGPDYEVMPDEHPAFPVRSEPGEAVYLPGMEPPPGVDPSQPAVIAGAQQQGKLMSPERAQLHEDLHYVSDPVEYDPNLDGMRSLSNGKPAGPARWIAPVGVREQLYGLTPAKPVPLYLAQTRVLNSRGEAAVVYHGTGAIYDNPDQSFANPDALFGPGVIYATDSPAIASGYPPEVGSIRDWLLGGREKTLAILEKAKQEGRVNYMVDWPSHIERPSDLVSTFDNPEAILGIPLSEVATVNYPNVRPMRLDIRNPFDIDKQHTGAEVSGLIDKLENALPDYDWIEARGFLGKPDTFSSYQTLTSFDAPIPTAVSGETIYNMLTGVRPWEPAGDVPGSNFTYGDPVQPTLGKAGLNRALEIVGYDGITHVGGARTGNDPHQVWIAFRPEQIHSPWDVESMSAYEAVAQATSMAKQASVMESAHLPEAMGKTKITDSDVASSLKASNPGGVSLIKGVNADQSTISQMLYEHPDVQFVEREGRLDAIVGGATPEQLGEYARHGLYTGQEVQTSNGHNGTVLNPATARGMVMIQRAGGGPPLRVSRAKVLPGRYGSNKVAPQLYDAFRDWALGAMNEGMAEAGMEPITSLTDPRAGRVLDSYVNNFFDTMGVESEAERHLLGKDFASRWVEDFKQLDPSMAEAQSRAVDAATVAENAREDSKDAFPVTLEEKATARGFVWLSAPGEGGVLRDAVNPESALEIPLSTDAAADTFLEHVGDRVGQDIAPLADVPMQVMESVPHESTVEPIMPVEDFTGHLEDTVALMDREGPFGADGGEPPQGPPSLPPGHYAMGGVPPEPESIAGQILKGDPVRVARFADSFGWHMTSRFRYTRYGMMNLQQNLADMGVDLGKAWEHFEAMSVGSTRAKNEAHPWINRWGAITRQMHPSVLRDGSAIRIHEIEDPNARLAAIYRLKDTHGLSDKAVQRHITADGEMGSFLSDFFGQWSGDSGLGRKMLSYMNDVRNRQATGLRGDKLYDTESAPYELKFFAEHAQGRNLQFRAVDARELGTYLVRSKMFSVFEAEPFNKMTEAWHLNRPLIEGSSPIPLSIRNYVGDYARLSRYGYNASGEIGVKALKMILEKSPLGLKVTSSEAAHLLNMPRSGMYMSMLAGRTSIFFRDAIQPLMALAKVRGRYMRGVYADVLTGKNKASLRALYQESLDGGWVEKEQPNLEAAGMFEEQQAGPDTGELAGATQDQLDRRELVASLGDKLHGLPNWLIRPSKSELSTLKQYGRLGQLNRLVTGHAAKRQSLEKLGDYRRSVVEAALQRNPALAQSYDDFAKESFFSSFEKPIQEKLKSLVEAGDDEEAANLFAREVSNWSQARYGRKEMPPAMRGEAGSWFGMFSNFSGQFLEGLNSIKNGQPSHMVRAAAVFGTVSALLRYAKAQTGWSFDKWVWEGAFGYTGGPLTSIAMRDFQATAGVINAENGVPVTQSQEGAMREVQRKGLLDAGDFNPYGGYVRSANELFNAASGTNPVEQMARYGITGDRGSSIDTHRIMEELSRQQDSTRIYNQTQHPAFPQGSLSPAGGQMGTGAQGQPRVQPDPKHPVTGAQY